MLFNLKGWLRIPGTPGLASDLFSHVYVQNCFCVKNRKFTSKKNIFYFGKLLE